MTCQPYSYNTTRSADLIFARIEAWDNGSLGAPGHDCLGKEEA